MLRIVTVCLIVSVFSGSWSLPYDDQELMHRLVRAVSPKAHKISDEEYTADYWSAKGRDMVKRKMEEPLNTNMAKNVIFFVGEGMSISTLTAARAFMGQMMGKSGEDSELSFEKFPYSGLSKTYCVDSQVGESACTGTAYLAGVKANKKTVGVTAKVPMGNCTMMRDKSNHVHSLAKMFVDKGASAGLVTTARVTYASAAGCYAHTANSDWESDEDVKKSGQDPKSCPDIAQQLILGNPGKDFKVILGGGRREFISNKKTDEEGSKGRRTDNRDLIAEWKNKRMDAEYVWNKSDLKKVNSKTKYLLGLFEPSHCKYHLETTDKEPSFVEMVESAIKILSKDDKGYFLFAEGGRIDHAHNDNLAKIALDQTVEFSKAIEKAMSMTNRKDTLIVVTSDHSSAMTISGYPKRGNDILGFSGDKATDGLPYMTLGYANGPGYRKEKNGKRVDVSKEDTKNINFAFPATVELPMESDAGDDVGVFALGPWQHLFTGVFEQSNIPHLISHAACYEKKPKCSLSETNKYKKTNEPAFPFLMENVTTKPTVKPTPATTKPTVKPTPTTSPTDSTTHHHHHHHHHNHH